MGSLLKMTWSSQTNRTARYVRGCKYKDRTLIGALLRGKVKVDGRWRSRKIGQEQVSKTLSQRVSLIWRGGGNGRHKSHCRIVQEQTDVQDQGIRNSSRSVTTGAYSTTHLTYC